MPALERPLARVELVRSLAHNYRVLAALAVALVSALIVIAVQAGSASAAGVSPDSQSWSCYGVYKCYAPRSGNIYQLEGTNYSQAGDVCVEISGVGGTLRCNSNPSHGYNVFYYGDKSHPIYGRPVVSVNSDAYGYANLAGYSY